MKFGLRNDGIEIVFFLKSSYSGWNTIFCWFLAAKLKGVGESYLWCNYKMISNSFSIHTSVEMMRFDELKKLFFGACAQPDGCQVLVLSWSRSPFCALGCATRMALCCDAGSTSGKPSEWIGGGRGPKIVELRETFRDFQWVLFAETLTPRRRSTRSLEPYMVALSSAARWGGELGSCGKPMGILKEDDFFLEAMGVFFLFFFFCGGLEFFFGGWEDGKMLGIFGLDWETYWEKSSSGSKASPDERCSDCIFSMVKP